VIPTVISQIASGARTLSLGALDPTRDFNFVADTVAAFQAIGKAEDKVLGQDFNAGSGREVTIGDLVRTIAEVMEAEVEVKADPARLRPADSEVMRLLADGTKLHVATGWEPRFPLEDGLAITATWFQSPQNLAHYRPTTYTV
jgi:UDP-glucose 4-epimerase